jgi:glycosidase
MALSGHPLIYEINTWTWLHSLEEKYGRAVKLATVPEQEWDAVGSLGMDALWLMGVWERSPRGVSISRTSRALQKEYRSALPDFSPADVVGSPYCVHRYEVDERLGGQAGLAAAREMLARRGIRLILDFVPNHVATDHSWVYEHPEYFIQGNGENLVKMPYEFFVSGGRIIACGRDPFFPPWTDTAQLNAFHPGHREAATETVLDIADRCDGVRCDMAMLLLNSVFEKTWNEKAGARPEKEYWNELVKAVREKYPEFLFIAEAYWDLEWDLQKQGFNYCYDKRLYDRLVHGNAEALRLHLSADLSYQKRLVRFLENHDEPRAASIFSPGRHRAVAVVITTLPGAKLFHEGQLEGRRIKLPVQLGRRPAEPADSEVFSFYRRLLTWFRPWTGYGNEWTLCQTGGWTDNHSYLNLVAWSWRRDEERVLIVVNFSDQRSQGRVKAPWGELRGRTWHLMDIFEGENYVRDGSEMVDPGMFVDLGPYGFHILEFEQKEAFHEEKELD